MFQVENKSEFEVMSMKKIRKHFIFHGQVQGVGFRYTAGYIAKSLDLTGWVMNEYDGTVVAELQGDERAIDQFINKIHRSDRYISIDWVDEKSVPVEETERSFRIRN